MIDICVTKQYAEKILEEWYDNGSPKNLRIRKESKNLYVISEDHD